MGSELAIGSITAGGMILTALGWLYGRLNGNDRRWEEHNTCHLALSGQIASVSTKVDILLEEMRRLRNGPGNPGL